MTEMRRKDKQISDEDAWKAVEESPFGVLAMSAEDGTPYAVPVNVVRSGDAVYFHGAMAGRKTNCLRENPKVCLTCVSHAQAVQERYTMQYTSAVIFGTVAEVTEPEEKTAALRLLCQRHTPDNHPEAIEKKAAGGVKSTAVWKLTVQAICGKSGR